MLVQICYPLSDGRTRAGLTVATVLLGYVLSVSHAACTRGPRAATALVATATVGGFAVEAIGVATGFPFGGYHYSGELGPKLLGVPLIIPLAWTWMAWPAWLAAIRLASRPAARIAIAAAGLAAWDVFLDPQMVAEGYWRWDSPTPALPGVPGVPIGNYLGWLGFAAILMTILVATGGIDIPQDANGRAGVPQDANGKADVPQDANGKADVPQDANGKTGVPQDANGKADVPKDESGKADVLQDASGRAGVPQDASDKAGVPQDANGKADVPKDESPRTDIPKDAGGGVDAPKDSDKAILALWLWTYASSVLAHAAFLGLPASAAWGAALMGATVLPLVFVLVRSARQPR